MKENDSGKENNYTLICVWQLCFIPLAHKAKIKGDIVESVLSAFNGVGMGCAWRQASSVGHLVRRDWGCCKISIDRIIPTTKIYPAQMSPVPRLKTPDMEP